MARSAGRQQIDAKIHFLVHEEGLSAKAAVGKALGMADSGDLGREAKAAAATSRRKRVKRMHWSAHTMDLYGRSDLIGEAPARY